jgi:hypothetical protein
LLAGSGGVVKAVTRRVEEAGVAGLLESRGPAGGRNNGAGAVGASVGQQQGQLVAAAPAASVARSGSGEVQGGAAGALRGRSSCKARLAPAGGEVA